jgi:hypothetical protein
MITFTSLALLGALAAQRAAAQVPSDTTAPPETVTRISFDFGAGAVAPFVARDFQVEFAPAPSAAPSGGSVRVRFSKAPDTITPELAHRGASAERVPNVVVEVLAGDKPVMTLRLTEVLVASDRMVVDNGARVLEEQRLSMEDGIAQLSADLQDAKRQLALTDALDKKKLSSTLELARARDRAQMLETRLDVQRRRLALLDRRIASESSVNEEVALVVPRFELESQGARTAWSTPGSSSPRPR